MIPKKLVLIVDDDADFREALALVLNLEGFQTAGAEDGAKALHFLGEGLRPDLILLDLRMPNVDGATFLRQLHAEGNGATPPVVVLSGEAKGQEESSALGAEGFLPKPVEMAELFATVHRLTG
jgi:CheY-like chemotaxis protein